MFDAFVQGLFNVFQPNVFAAVVAGVLVGLVIGIIPVIGTVSGLALLIPFVYGMSPFVALPLLLAVASVCMTGGSITAILLNIPGDPANAATLIDGYPMTRKGEAGRAIGAALTASGTGGVAGALLALVFIPLVIPVVLALFSAEMFFVILIGISFLAVVSQGGQLKGLISGGLGLLLAFVGLDVASGTTARYTFGSGYLFEGLPIIPVVVGLFAGAEIVELAVYGEAIARVKVAATPRQQMLVGAKDVLRNAWLWFRSVVLGYIVGVIPGIGAVSAIFMAYGQAKQSSKQPERFGTGCVEGVIAPESANNAVTGGALLTTLAFGIPGSTPMALLLAAFLVVGIKPGPGLLIDHPELSFTMIWTVAIANVLGAVFCFPIIPYLLRVTTIRPEYIFTTIGAVMFVSVFATGETMMNVVLALVFAGVGVLMRRFGYSRPALVLGFVLGALFERYFWLAFKLQGPLFFLRPICLALIALMIGLFSFSSIRSAVRRWRKREAS